jgi:hypothetical protein
MTDVANRANGAKPDAPPVPQVLAARAVIGKDEGRPRDDGTDDPLAPDLVTGDDDDSPRRKEERVLSTEPAFIDKLKRRLRGPNRGLRIGLCEIWRPVEGATPDENGKLPKELVFSFRVVSMFESEYNRIRDKHTTWERNKQFGPARLPVKQDVAAFRSELIYEATHQEDKKMWEDLELQELSGAMTAEETPEKVLWAGEKDQVVETIEQISGFRAVFEGDDIKNS